MADVTYNELQTRVGRKLQIIGDAETLSADYAAVIIDGLLSVQAQINRVGAASFDVANGIDYPYVDSVAEIAAAEVVDDFQILEPRRSQLIAAGKWGLPNRSLAERRLRDLLDGTTNKLQTEVQGITVV